MERERDIFQRALGCFGFSTILHAAALAAILIAPALQLQEDPKGAEMQSAASPEPTKIDLIGDTSTARPAPAPTDVAVATPDAAPVAEPTTVPVAKSAPATPVAAAAVAAKPEPISKPKQAPVATASLPTKLPAKARSKVARAKSDLATRPDGDIETAPATAENTQTQNATESAPTGSAHSATDDTAPIEASAAKQIESGSQDAPAAVPAPAAAAFKPADENIPARPQKALAPSASALTTALTGAPAQASTKSAGAPTEIRDAADLREAPGNPKPVYPEEDRLNHRQGTVVFLGLVTPNGNLEKVQLEKSSSSASIDQAATSAFQQYRYKGGQQGWIRKRFTFSLKGEEQEIPARRKSNAVAEAPASDSSSSPSAPLPTEASAAPQ